MQNMKRGQLWLADLGTVKGFDDHIKRGIRPVVIVSNNKANKSSPVIHVVPITTKIQRKRYLPTHVFLNSFRTPGLRSHSVAACEQVQAVNTVNMIRLLGSLDGMQMFKISLAIAVQFALNTDN